MPFSFMRSVLTILLTLCGLANLCAQEFGCHWISAPNPDSLSHIWFRQTYLEQGAPHTAYLTIASTGYYKLYVNECNVGIAPYYPPRQPNSDTPVEMTFDVTPYLRPDTNVVALCYAPSFPNVDSCQVSVLFHGVDSAGKSFCRVSDGNWLCRKANSRWTADGNEIVDGRFHNSSWKAAQFDIALWLPVEQRKDSKGRQVQVLTPSAPVLRHIHTNGYRYFDRDSAAVSYEFDTGFYGMLRLTLRESRRGERIFYDGLQYVCNGELDEQAYPVFRMGYYRRVRVTGGKYFRRDQITTVEALQMAYLPCFDAALW